MSVHSDYITPFKHASSSAQKRLRCDKVKTSPGGFWIYRVQTDVVYSILSLTFKKNGAEDELINIAAVTH